MTVMLEQDDLHEFGIIRAPIPTEVRGSFAHDGKHSRWIKQRVPARERPHTPRSHPFIYPTTKQKPQQSGL